MRRISFAAVIAVFSIVAIGTSCIKSSTDNGQPNGCTDVALSVDSVTLVQYAQANNLGTFTDTLGMFYQIVSQGTGGYPNENSIVYVSYEGKLMNGTIFDSTTNYASTGFELNQLILGWQIALPKIQAGGHIRMLVPSAYGYGCQGAGNTVPTNSPLYFDVTLVKFD